MLPLLFLMASSSLKEKEEGASYWKGLQGVLEGKAVEGTRERTGTGEWLWIGAEEHTTPEIQTRLKTSRLLQAPALCTWLLGSDDTSASMPGPYRAILLLLLIFNSLRIQYHQLHVWMPPTAKQGVNSLPHTELLNLILQVFASV